MPASRCPVPRERTPQPPPPSAPQRPRLGPGDTGVCSPCGNISSPGRGSLSRSPRASWGGVKGPAWNCARDIDKAPEGAPGGRVSLTTVLGLGAETTRVRTRQGDAGGRGPGGSGRAGGEGVAPRPRSHQERGRRRRTGRDVVGVDGGGSRSACSGSGRESGRRGGGGGRASR